LGCLILFFIYYLTIKLAYGFALPQQDTTQPQQQRSGFWTIEYYTKYFDVNTTDVSKKNNSREADAIRIQNFFFNQLILITILISILISILILTHMHDTLFLPHFFF